MGHRFERERSVAVDAVRQASGVCRHVQSTITADVLEKKDRSPVTIADFASQALICRALEAAFPADPVIGEEDSAELRTGDNAPFLKRVRDEIERTGIAAGDDEICRWIDRGTAGEYSPRFWTLDPIDGTKGFLRGEQYAVSLALVIDGQIQVAALGCPNLESSAGAGGNHGAIFYAVRGEGAWCVPLAGPGSAVRVQVSQTDDSRQARICESVESSHSSHALSAKVSERLGIAAAPARLDSQAKYAVVARGDAEIYMRLPAKFDYREKIWVHAGGVLIVEEAGGTVTDVTGKPLEFHHGAELSANRGVIATNGPLHAQVLDGVREYYRTRESN